MRVFWEEVAELLHEPVEIGFFAVLALFEHVIELSEHVFHAGHVFGRHVLDRSRHLVDVLLHQLLAQFLDKFLELLARFRRCEVVVLQISHHASEVLRHQVERQVPFGSNLFGELLAPGIAGIACFLSEFIDCLAFGVDYFTEFFRDFVVNATEVMTFERFTTFTSELVHHFSQALHALAVVGLESLLHHAAQGGVDIAVIQQIVSDFVEDVGGIKVESDLCAIPPRVLNPIGSAHRGTVPGILQV